ncbi:MAG TPA: TetR/AcrR family transcriptional regulator [Telluria sp.]|nr:TetR/AcrR family transcriptional regulator [Telluria sp.]
MKVSREQAAQNRERVVQTAATLFRERGYSGIGVADLMKGAGLTHGGFYGNFGSKEALMAEAVTYALDKALLKWDKLVRTQPDDPLEAITAAYLSTAHRDHPGQGCVMAALAPDVARLAPAVRSAMTDGVRQQLDKLAALMPPESADDKRQAALVTYASMVGALVLARAVNDEALSEELLGAVHAALTGMA